MSDYDDLSTTSNSADSKQSSRQPATKRSGQSMGKPQIPGAVKGKPGHSNLPDDRKQEIDDAIAREHARKGPKGLHAKVSSATVLGEWTRVGLTLGSDHGVRRLMVGYLKGVAPNGEVYTTPPESLEIVELDGSTSVAIAKVPVALFKGRKLEVAILNP
jgi:hypothetical protein